MTKTSKHYTEDRIQRALTIEEIGEGTVIWETIQWDSRRKKFFLYQITDNAILIVKATDKADFIVTKIIARPNRLKQYWKAIETENPVVFKKAIAHAKAKMYY